MSVVGQARRFCPIDGKSAKPLTATEKADIDLGWGMLAPSVTEECDHAPESKSDFAGPGPLEQR